MSGLHTIATGSQTSASTSPTCDRERAPVELEHRLRDAAHSFAGAAGQNRAVHSRLCWHALGLGCFVSVGRELDTAIERVKLAESLGYECVYVTHIAARDPFTVLTAYAGATERIRLGTGVTPIYARTPVATAQAAATIDEYSGGRMVLGLGVSHRPVVEGWYGQQIDKPVREMREYLEHRPRDPPRRGPAAGREVADRLPLHGLRARAPTCRSTSPASPPRCSGWPASWPTA